MSDIAIDINIVNPFDASKKLREIVVDPNSHIFVKDIIFEGVERTQIEFNDLDDDFEIDSLSFSNVANYEQMINVHTFDLDNIDSMREDILSKTKIQSAYIIDKETIEPYNLGLQQMSDKKIKSYFSQEGLGLKTYQSDMFNVWLDTEWIDGETGINQISKISTADGYFTMDRLQFGKKVYDMLNLIS